MIDPFRVSIQKTEQDVLNRTSANLLASQSRHGGFASVISGAVSPSLQQSLLHSQKITAISL